MKIKEDRGFQIIANIVMCFLSVVAILPFILMIVSSFTDDKAIIRDGYSFFPSETSLLAYKYLLDNSVQLLHAYGITIFITIIGTIVSLAITSMLAYPISRKDLPLRNFFTFLVVITLLFSGGLVPTYLVYTQIFHIKNTIWALIVPGLLMNGFNVMLVRTYYVTSIPDALIESAKIDGAGEMRIFTKIIMPLSLPIMATVGLLVGIGYWNDWNNGLIYLTNTELFSIQNVLNRMMTDIQFMQSSSSLAGKTDAAMANIPDTTVRMAIAVIGMLPIIAAYPFFQNYFVKGITVGAVKG